MQAIHDTGNRLIAALDPSDSVGVIDSFFPETHFFTEFERFDRHVDKLRRKGRHAQIDYVSICSPNYLHDSHIRFAMRSDTDAICEKPLVLNPWNIDGLEEVERENRRKINTILQLRLHPSIIALRKKLEGAHADRKFDVVLTYITSRGRWYLQSWKGDDRKSGGIATNIGVHFFDMLHFLFGRVQDNIVHVSSEMKSSGYLEYEHARVCWFLSIDLNDVPASHREKGQRTYRSVTIGGEEFEFSGGFTDLHTRSYEEILAGRGFGLEDTRQAVETVACIRNSPPVGPKGEYHPFIDAVSLA